MEGGYHARMSDPQTKDVAVRRERGSRETSADVILARAGARRMSTEEFAKHFGDLPTDGEG
jgi:hypothetical protein